jgi:hypothetical protein
MTAHTSNKINRQKRNPFTILSTIAAAMGVNQLINDFGTNYILADISSQLKNTASNMSAILSFLKTNAKQTSTVTVGSPSPVLQSTVQKQKLLDSSAAMFVNNINNIKFIADIIHTALRGQTPSQIFMNEKLDKLAQQWFHTTGLRVEFHPTVLTSTLLPIQTADSSHFLILTKVPAFDPKPFDLIEIVPFPHFVPKVIAASLTKTDPHLLPKTPAIIPLISHKFMAVRNNQYALYHNNPQCTKFFCPRPNKIYTDTNKHCGPAQYFHHDIATCLFRLTTSKPYIISPSIGTAIVVLPPSITTTAFTNCPHIDHLGPEQRLKFSGSTLISIPRGCNAVLKDLDVTINGQPIILSIYHRPLNNSFEIKTTSLPGIPTASAAITRHIKKWSFDQITPFSQDPDFISIKTHTIWNSIIGLSSLFTFFSIFILTGIITYKYSNRARLYTNRLKKKIYTELAAMQFRLADLLQPSQGPIPLLPPKAQPDDSDND